MHQNLFSFPPQLTTTFSWSHNIKNKTRDMMTVIDGKPNYPTVSQNLNCCFSSLRLLRVTSSSSSLSSLSLLSSLHPKLSALKLKNCWSFCCSPRGVSSDLRLDQTTSHCWLLHLVSSLKSRPINLCH